jgi:hypothetical protein
MKGKKSVKNLVEKAGTQIVLAVILVLVASGAGGCGRYVHNNAQSTESPAVARPQATDFVEIGWEDVYSEKQSARNGWITSDGTHYVSDLPISIPSSASGTFDFKVDVPKRYIGKALAYHAGFLAKDGTPLGMSVQNFAREDAALKFQVNGVYPALHGVPSGLAGEKAAVLQFTGTDPTTGTTEFEGKMEITTPPEKIDVVQESIDSFESRSGVLPSSRKSISVGGVTLYLLQVLTFHNPTDFPIDVALPAKPTGSLVAQFQDIDIDQKICSFTTHSSQRSRALSSQLLVVPFGLEVISDDDAAQVRVSIPARGNEFAGIYSTGKEVEQVAEGRYPKPIFDETEVTDACNAHCDQAGGWTMWCSGGGEHWLRLGYPGASGVCDSLSRPFPLTGASRPNDQKLVDQCAEWELTNGTTPWDDHRYCQANKPGNPGSSSEKWILSPHQTKIQSGTQALPITVEISPDHLNGNLSFSGSNDLGDPESQSAPVFSKSSVQRD